MAANNGTLNVVVDPVLATVTIEDDDGEWACIWVALVVCSMWPRLTAVCPLHLMKGKLYKSMQVYIVINIFLSILYLAIKSHESNSTNLTVLPQNVLSIKCFYYFINI